MIVVALPKGRIADDVLSIFSKIFLADFSFENRRLILEKGEFKFLLVRSQDVPVYVENAAADIGFCGEDVLTEQGSNVARLLDLGTGKCRVVLGMPSGKTLDLSRPEIVIATKMPRIAKAYFDKKGLSVKIVKLYGSIELAPLVGLSDGIVDIVETGTTMKENGLYVVEDIMNSSVKMFASPASYIQKKEKIIFLKQRIEQILKA
ncbi:MAG: ATP phosphoribosyltransferase [Helicobacteraceae bacterium]